MPNIQIERTHHNKYKLKNISYKRINTLYNLNVKICLHNNQPLGEKEKRYIKYKYKTFKTAIYQNLYSPAKHFPTNTFLFRNSLTNDETDGERERKKREKGREKERKKTNKESIQQAEKEKENE